MSTQKERHEEATTEQIAVIGMSASFPGAPSIGEYWNNIRGGVESIVHFRDDEIQKGEIPQDWIHHPNFVKVGTRLSHHDEFDAGFFGFSPREALMMDPQKRLFIEKCWEALENAGYDSGRYDEPIGVFAGASPNVYRDLLPAADLSDPAGRMEFMIASELDYLTTLVSYKLNLKGPSLAVQTACSTSLTAVHLACQSLLTYQCSIALAGGASINLKRPWGYIYQEGTILSPDGRCRPFDAGANGTVVGQGVGVVVLKRLSEATADNDTIYAVIKGSALNNDGALKIGFTAPSVEGQVEVIAMAQAISGVPASTIGYVETHGTGTKLGDPIEFAALRQAFELDTERKGFCALGSVKANIGHADAAAGIAGFLKVVLSLWHKEIPPLLHYERPNPQIDLANSPFHIPTGLIQWSTDGSPRRAGVSSMGIGGTNVHVVLEEAPSVSSSASSRPYQLILLSAKSPSAVKESALRLSQHFDATPNLSLADAAYTLAVGRKTFPHRAFWVCRSREEAAVTIRSVGQGSFSSRVHPSEGTRPVFMFTGQGAQHAGMGRDLYLSEPVFRATVDSCAEALLPALSVDIRQILYPEAQGANEGAGRINQTAFSQPALFVIEFALGKLLDSWGIQPCAMVGHSIGEYVAGCLAGVFDLKSALSIVAARGRFMQEMPAGAMVAVFASEKSIQPFLNDQLVVAAVNAPGLCVVSGDLPAIDRLEERLRRDKIDHKRLVTSHAFHSHMMEPAARRLEAEIGRYRLSPPRVAWVSNRTGTWITDEEATNPRYWGEHLLREVRFSQCLETLIEAGHRVFLEVGPGSTLCAFLRQQRGVQAELTILQALRSHREKRSDSQVLLSALGKLWVCGLIPNWEPFYANERRQRIPLPAYPFERKRFWPVESESSQRPSLRVLPILNEARKSDRPVCEEASPPCTETVGDPGLQTKTERELAQIWQELMHLGEIGPNDNYFELGGSSLLAARLFDHIEKRLGKRLPLALLYEAPTIRELASRVEDRAFVPSWSSLVEINRGDGSKPPLFLMHSEGGNVLEYWPLCRYLGQDQPVYALQAEGLEGDTAVATTIEEMAAHFIVEIRKVQKTGPFFLGGYCLGGLVAYEMARQLIDRKERVSFLSLISTRTPQNIRQLRSAASCSEIFFDLLRERFGLELNNLSYLSRQGKLGHARERISRLRHMAKVHGEKLSSRLLSSLGYKLKHHSRDFILHRSVDLSREAFFQYQPKPVDIDLILFWPKKRPGFYADDDSLGWSDLIKGHISSYGIDCFHKNIMKEPHIQVVGRCFNERLSAVQKKQVNLRSPQVLEKLDAGNASRFVWKHPIPISESHRLKAGTIDIWVAEVDGLEAEVEKYERLLSTSEAARSNRFHLTRDRNRYVARHGILRLLLSAYMRCKPEHIEIYSDSKGKPHVANRAPETNLQFSMSHSSGLVLFAIGQSISIGIDIEKIRPFPELRGVVGRNYAPAEIKEIDDSPLSARLEVFFQLWARKEAILKASGNGLSLDLRCVDVSTVSPGGGTWNIRKIGGNGLDCEFHLMDLKVATGFAAAIATAGSCETALRYRRYEPGPSDGRSIDDFMETSAFGPVGRDSCRASLNNGDAVRFLGFNVQDQAVTAGNLKT
jgi:phosphopantetheine--protein transferase-like protein